MAQQTRPRCRYCQVAMDPLYPECPRCGRTPDTPEGIDHRPDWLRKFHEMPARKSARVSSNDQRWLEED